MCTCSDMREIDPMFPLELVGPLSSLLIGFDRGSPATPICMDLRGMNVGGKSSLTHLHT